MKRLITAIILLIASCSVYGQVDTTKELQKNNTTGFAFKNLAADSSFRLPLDTFKLKSTWRGFAFKGDVPYYWNGYKWLSSFGSSFDTTSIYAAINGKADSLRRSGLTVQMRKGGVWTNQFYLPDSIPPTPTLQQVLTAGSTLETSHTIEIANNSIEFVNAADFTIEADNGVNKSSIVVRPDSTNLNLKNGNLFILPLNNTLSTTGKKILLRDTVTGLVQNIDPALLPIPDSLRRSGLTVQMRKGGVWTNQFDLPDTATGGTGDLQTVTDNGNTIENNFIEFDGGRVISGDIVNDNFNRYGIGANYDTAFPNVTRTYNGSYLEVNNGAGNFNNYITYVNPTGRNRWTQTLKFVPVNLSGTTYGIGIGLMSSNSFWPSDFTIHFILDNGSNKGKMTLYNTSNSSVETSGSGITFNTGDTLFATVERSDNIITSTFYNQTQNVSANYTYSYSTATAGSFQLPNTAKAAIYFFGGNQKIFNYTFASKETKDNVVVIGNSITAAGYTASTMSKRYASMLFPARYQYEVSGGPGDRSADVVSKLEEIKLLQPRYAVLNIGVNDALSGVSTSTFSTNIQRIVDTLQNNNITPIIISSCPNNSYNLTPYNDTLSAIATRESIKYVNTFDSLRNGTNWKANYTTDNIHPNDSGHLVIARIITRYAPEILGDTVLKVNRPVYNSSVRYFLGLNELNGNLEFNTVSATPTTNYVELAPSATQTGTSIDVTGDGGTIDNIATFRSAATYSSIVVDATKGGGTGQAALWFNKNRTNAWQFGSDFAANGTRDFYVYDNTNSRVPFYITSGGDVRIGGTSGYAGSQVVTIEQGGDVGIGVTGPTSKLEIAGDVKLSSANPRLKIDATGFAGVELYSNTVRKWLIFNGSGNSFVWKTDTENKMSLTQNGDVGIGGNITDVGTMAGSYLAIKSGNVGIGTNTPSSKLSIDGDAALVAAGNKLKIATGSNASIGTGTLSSGTATISTTAVTASSLIFVQYTSCSSCGSTYIGTITNGTSFVVNSTNASDASTFNWWIIN